MRQIIVSCTTTRERLRYLRYTLESIKLQSLPPDVVILNISREPYLADDGISELPDWLEQANVEIRWVPNTGPYRKLLPTLEAAADSDLVVTMDDDILYGPQWLSSLVRHADENPNAIVSGRAREIRKTAFGSWRNYRTWGLISEQCVGQWVLPTGCGGVVYRKALLDIDFLSAPAFMDLAPTTDDLWFRMASLLKNVSVLVDPAIDRDNAHMQHGVGLEKINTGRHGRGSERLFGRRLGGLLNAHLGIKDTPNDFAWAAICRYANWPD